MLLMEKKGIRDGLCHAIYHHVSNVLGCEQVIWICNVANITCFKWRIDKSNFKVKFLTTFQVFKLHIVIL